MFTRFAFGIIWASSRESLFSEFPTRSDTNRTYSHRRKLESYKVAGLYCLCSDNKGAGQLRGYRFVPFVFVFNNMFSYYTANSKRTIFESFFYSFFLHFILFVTLFPFLFQNTILGLIRSYYVTFRKNVVVNYFHKARI